jgi:excisionase family DNA binding protein
MKTYDLHEAATILHLHPDTLQRRAKAREIPGAKPGKEWVFREEALAAYLIQLETQPRQAAKKETTSCSTNVVKLTGSTSLTPAADVLDGLLAQRTKRQRKSCMTSSKHKVGDRHV